MNSGEIKTLVKSTLNDVGAPVAYQTYTGPEKTYFTFFILEDKDVAWGDGKPLASAASIQLDGWCHQNGPRKGDMDDLNDSAKEKLLAAGFRYGGGRDFYEEDTKTFHRVQQFYYSQED
jgi:hypothetical protein